VHDFDSECAEVGSKFFASVVWSPIEDTHPSPPPSYSPGLRLCCVGQSCKGQDGGEGRQQA